METNSKNLKIIDGLVDLEKLDDSFVIDIKYFSHDNFMGRSVYPLGKCILQLKTAEKLIKANDEFKKFGYRLKVYDGYRPVNVQKFMWELMPDENFVAPPTRGSVHNRGAAVDVTLVDERGKEVEMPSSFDDFTEKAWIDYTDTSEEAVKNREFLACIMEKYGFFRIESEWWHFGDIDFRNYPLMDVKIEEFI